MIQAAHMRQAGYWAFKGADIIDLVPLIERLKHASDPISVYVCRQLSERVLQEITNLKDFKTEGEIVGAALATDLTKLLSSTDLYDRERFKNIRLRWQTRTLIQQKPSGSRLVQLNRMLLEDAYPRELKKRLNAYFERDIRFRIRQCIRIDKGPISSIRMPRIRRQSK